MVSDAFGRQDSLVLHIMHGQEIPIFLPFFTRKIFYENGMYTQNNLFNAI